LVAVIIGKPAERATELIICPSGPDDRAVAFRVGPL